MSTTANLLDTLQALLDKNEDNAQPVKIEWAILNELAERLEKLEEVHTVMETWCEENGKMTWKQAIEFFVAGDIMTREHADELLTWK